jgi:hypothetical protein
MLGPHKCSISGTEQEFGVDERTQQRIARRPIKTPKPLCLSGGETQPRHLDVLALNPSQYILEWLLLCCHDSGSLRFGVSRGLGLKSNRDAIGPQCVTGDQR